MRAPAGGDTGGSDDSDDAAFRTRRGRRRAHEHPVPTAPRGATPEPVQDRQVDRHQTHGVTQDRRADGDIVPSSGSRRHRRRPGRLLAGTAAVVAVLVVVVAVVLLVGRDGQDQGVPAVPTDAGAQEQATTMLVVQDGDGAVVGGSLLASDAGTTSALLVPPTLLVDVAGSGRVPFAESLQTGSGAPGRAVADLLDVRVDGTWVISAAGLTAFTDAVGGLEVDVDVPVSVGDRQLPVGEDQRLDGAQVVALLEHTATGETQASRLTRLDQVAAAVVEALPDLGGPSADGTTVDVLAAFAGGSTDTFAESELVRRLAVVQRHLAGRSYGATVLPTTEGAVVGDLVALRLDRDATDELLAARFAGAVLGDAAGARVLVQNGDGTPGLGEQARDLLVAGGFRYVGGGNAPALGRDRTVVVLPDDSPGSRELGAAVAEALGLPADALAVGQEAPTLADVVVVLGGDFAAAAGAPGQVPKGSGGTSSP